LLISNKRTSVIAYLLCFILTGSDVLRMLVGTKNGLFKSYTKAAVIIEPLIGKKLRRQCHNISRLE